MEQTKPSLSINLDLIKEDELRYFFRPFFWKKMDYNILWEEKKQAPINLKISHKEVIEIILKQPSIKEKVGIKIAQENQKKQENTLSYTNDVLASYHDIVKRYKS